MDSIIFILFLCVFPPLFLSLFLLDKRARLYVGFIVIGFYICFTVSGINSWFLTKLSGDFLYVTTTVTPIVEEIMKAIPILVYAYMFDNRREKLLSLAFLTGIGFAIMENMIVLVSSLSVASLFWAIVRGFASAGLHGVCTGMVAYGISFVKLKKKLFFTGTFALLNVAISTHAIYNCLVQSYYAWAGYLLPIAIYFALIINQCLYIKGEKKKRKEAMQLLGIEGNPSKVKPRFASINSSDMEHILQKLAENGYKATESKDSSTEKAILFVGPNGVTIDVVQHTK